MLFTLLRVFFFFLLVIIRNFRFWKGTSSKSENAYLRKFEELLDVIMGDTDLIMSDGENVCGAAARDSLRSILEEDEELTEFGRGIDLLVSCSRLDVSVVLCSTEFKKQGANNPTITH
jgi:ABC-type transport system involved in cytochrome bd biosynthesis fused ATPase/permease subunit